MVIKVLLLRNHFKCALTVLTVSEDASFWNTNAHDELDKALLAKKNVNRAKNIILFVGDGMGMPTITAGRILKGQLKGNDGEDEKLAVDSFPYLGLAKVGACYLHECLDI